MWQIPRWLPVAVDVRDLPDILLFGVFADDIAVRIMPVPTDSFTFTCAYFLSSPAFCVSLVVVGLLSGSELARSSDV